MHRVAITGIGSVSPLGLNARAAWQAALKGESGISAHAITATAWPNAGLVKGDNPHVSGKEAHRLDRFTQLALWAAHEAIKDSGLHEISDVIAGSARGGISTLEAACKGRPGAFTMAASTPSMAASHITIRHGIHGRALGISNACASGLYAIGEAYEAIRSGRSKSAIAGGAEAPVCRLALEGYGRAGALSRLGAARPFHPKRDGFVLGEGASLLVLERHDDAIRRGAHIHGEIIGYGTSCDAAHETSPDARGQALAIRRAMGDTRHIGTVFAHATGTRLGDAVEAHALRDVFGDATPPVCALKALSGHMLGASGAFDLCMALMALEARVMPVSHTGSEYDWIRPGPRIDGDTALVSSFGFGGLNAALVVKGYN